MSLTVNDLMMLPEFDGARIIAGHIGLSRNIDYIDILESPGGISWFKPNDLVITTTYPLLQSPGLLLDFVEQLSDLHVSALAIKIGRYIKEIPKVLIDQADAYDLALIELPPTAVYADIISSVTAQIIDSHMLQLQKSLDTNYMFIDIAKQGGDISEIANALAHTINCPVIIENEKYEVISFAFPPNHDSTYSENQLLSANHYIKSHFYIPALKKTLYTIYHFPSTAQTPYPFSVSPIVYCGSILGNITVAITDTRVVLNELALRNASTFTALSLSTIRSQMEKERMIRDGVLTDLLHGKAYTKESVSYWLSYFKLERELPCVVFLIRPTDAAALSEEKFYVFRQLVTNRIRDAYFFLQDHDLIFIRSFGNTAPQNLPTAVNKYFSALRLDLEINSKNTNFYIAISDLCEDFYHISKNYHQATVALEIGQTTLPPDSLCYYSELDLYYIFFEHQDRALLVQFALQYIGPLLQQDIVNFNGLETIRAFLENGCSIEKTSITLALHKNTIKYRIHRLREVLGNNLDNSQYLLKLQLSIMIYKLFPENFS